LSSNDTAIIFYRIDHLRDRLNTLKNSFGNFEVLHTAAIKTNPQSEVLSAVVKSGFGLEAASFEEVIIAVKAGAGDHRIIYNSPVKTQEEINYCANNLCNIHINANSLDELKRYPKGVFSNIGLRINPVVQPNDDSLYNVSSYYSKFGEILNKEPLIDAIGEYNVKTLHVHVGSKLNDFDNSLKGVRKVLDFADEVNRHSKEGISNQINTINIGGGIPAGNNSEESAKIMMKYADELSRLFNKSSYNYNIITEFGQWIHTHTGFIISKVEYVKKINGKQIIYLHVGADLFVRQAYTKSEAYAYDGLKKSGEFTTSKNMLTDLAGPLCFNGDYLVKNLEMPEMEVGEYIAIYKTGANVLGLWSRHCSRTITKIVGFDSENNPSLRILSERTNPFL
jgi:diaminopimelate decarboxylase